MAVNHHVGAGIKPGFYRRTTSSLSSDQIVDFTCTHTCARVHTHIQVGIQTVMKLEFRILNANIQIWIFIIFSEQGIVLVPRDKYQIKIDIFVLFHSPRSQTQKIANYFIKVMSDLDPELSFPLEATVYVEHNMSLEGLIQNRN